jgi:hypothetical protein
VIALTFESLKRVEHGTFGVVEIGKAQDPLGGLARQPQLRVDLL